MNPEIKILPEKKLIGKRMIICFANNKTFELWRNFMPRYREIKNPVGKVLYSIQIYESSFFNNFDPNREFEKWAAIEVTDFDKVPDDMESFTLTGGLYAVFLYKGAASAAAGTFQYILGSWLPESEYKLDNRPHFEILGEKYINEDPASEEEIWIPIKPKE